MLNAVPAVWVGIVPPPSFSTLNDASAPGETTNVLLVPVMPLPLSATIVADAFARLSVTLSPLNTPDENADVVPSPTAPVPAAFEDSDTVLPKSVFVFPFASSAVTLMRNAVPAVWPGMLPVAFDSTRKLASAPGETVNVLLEPVFPPPVAVIWKLPVFVIVTACVASTPAVNAAVVVDPENVAPVALNATVLVYVGSVLPN